MSIYRIIDEYIVSKLLQSLAITNRTYLYAVSEELNYEYMN
jgi:hypothetical protein